MSKKKSKPDHSLVALLRAAKNFDRISHNYYALQESQRHVEQHNYDRAKDQFELMIGGVIDHRIRIIIQDTIQKKLKKIIDEELVNKIEDQVMCVVESDSMLKKLRRSMAMTVQEKPVPVIQNDSKKNDPIPDTMEELLDGNNAE